jgi:hypothetical protein
MKQTLARTGNAILDVFPIARCVLAVNLQLLTGTFCQLWERRGTLVASLVSNA